MIYTKPTTYNFLFVCTIITCLIIDFGQFFLKGTLFIPLLLCIYCTLLLYNAQTHAISLYPFRRSNRNKSYSFTKITKYRSENWRIHLSIVALLQCLEFFCFYNFFSLAWMVLIPTTIIAIFLKKYLYPSITNIVTLALISCLLQIYGAEGYILPTWPTTAYTIVRISATLIIVISFSLTINVWGMQDNRA